METITEQEIETLKGVIAQARPNEWTDFPGNGRSQRTHIGYLIETTIGEAQIPLFETNTNAKRADVLLAIYARNYLPSLITEVEHLRAENARLRAECEAAGELREEISIWLKMLTTEIFTEPDFVKARALLEAGGMTLDGISASNMRHVLTRLAEKDEQVRAARLTRADGEG